jgi:hypothetical protein
MSYEFTSEAASMHCQICGGPFFKFDLGSVHVLALISKQDDWDVVTLTSGRASSLSDANGFGVRALPKVDLVCIFLHTITTRFIFWLINVFYNTNDTLCMNVGL